MIYTAIIDDEPSYRATLKQMLEKVFQEYGEQAVIDTYESGMSLLMKKDMKYNLVFMDIEMPYIDGLETAKHLRENDNNFVLVFVTNMVQYAVNGYEYDATDYIVKPLSYDSLRFKMRRILQHVQKTQQQELMLKTDTGKQFISTSDIYYVEVIKHKLIYHTARGNFEVWGTMSETEEVLDPQQFARCNVSYLINLRYVDGIYADEVLVRNDRIKMSRAKKQDFMMAVMRYMKGGR